MPPIKCPLSPAFPMALAMLERSSLRSSYVSTERPQSLSSNERLCFEAVMMLPSFVLTTSSWDREASLRLLRFVWAESLGISPSLVLLKGQADADIDPFEMAVINIAGWYSFMFLFTTVVKTLDWSCLVRCKRGKQCLFYVPSCVGLRIRNWSLPDIIVCGHGHFHLERLHIRRFPTCVHDSSVFQTQIHKHKKLSITTYFIELEDLRDQQ